jgi:hypothetical protein
MGTSNIARAHFSDGAGQIVHSVFQPENQLVFLFGQRGLDCGIAVVTKYLRPSPARNPLYDSGHEVDPSIRNQRSLSKDVPNKYIFMEFCGR